jgi:hypothetical protein
MKKFLFLCLTVFIITSGHAQNDSVGYKHSLGLSAGVSTGLGFSYRYWPKKVGFQVTGIPIFSTNNIFSSVALSGLITIKDFSNIQMFGYFGNHLIYDKSSYTDVVVNPITGVITETKMTSEDYTYNTALGVGFRFNFWGVLDFNLQTGYGASFEYNPNLFRTVFAAEAGLYYHF